LLGVSFVRGARDLKALEMPVERSLKAEREVKHRRVDVGERDEEKDEIEGDDDET